MPNPRVPGRATDCAVPGLDLTQLDRVVQELFVAGLAGYTQKSYMSGEKRFMGFCAAAGLRPFPVTEQILLAFVAFLFKEGLVVGTVKLYLAAVRHAQIVLGFQGPTDCEHTQAGVHHEGSPEGYLDEGEACPPSYNSDDALQAKLVVGETPVS